jgi:mannose-6-phosphate isomerase-like protein (cupin superfamily)
MIPLCSRFDSVLFTQKSPRLPTAEISGGRMTKSLEQIEHNGEMLALIVREEYSKPGITFFTPNDLSQQLAYMHHPAGKVIDAHVHNPVQRSIAYTQETLFIKRGRLRVDFFSEQQKYLESRELKAGDVILLVKGGHGFEVLEELEMIEVKQGPYAGDQDKTKFVGKIPPDPQK